MMKANVSSSGAIMPASSSEPHIIDIPIVVKPKRVHIKPTAKTATSATNVSDVIPDTTSLLKSIVETEIHESVLKTMSKETVLNHDGVLSHLGEYVEDPYTVIETYFEGKYLERLVRHQLESYNHFVTYQIQKTIDMFNPVVIRSENDYVPEQDKYFLEVNVHFENFKLYSPQIHENNGATKIMLPQEAKLRNFTYASNMTVDLRIDISI